MSSRRHTLAALSSSSRACWVTSSNVQWRCQRGTARGVLPLHIGTADIVFGASSVPSATGEVVQNGFVGALEELQFNRISKENITAHLVQRARQWLPQTTTSGEPFCKHVPAKMVHTLIFACEISGISLNRSSDPLGEKYRRNLQHSATCFVAMDGSEFQIALNGWGSHTAVAR